MTATSCVRRWRRRIPGGNQGRRTGYHVNTFGVLVGELVRRVYGETLGTMVRHEIAGPLGADFHIGVQRPDLARVADFNGLTEVPPPPPPPTTDVSDAQEMERNAYFNPPEFSGAGVINSERWRTAELASTNGHASGRGIARLFEALVAGGQLPGTDVVDPVALADAVQEQVYGDDVIPCTARHASVSGFS